MNHPDDPPQQGVREIEAVRSIWTPRLLKIAYLSVFLVILGCSLETQASSNLVTYVTSDFSQHALVSTISVSTGLIAGVARVPIAKLIDIWGRGEGYAAMVACTTIGYVLQVFLADTSSLRNRALAFSLSSTPYIVTTFAGPAVAQYFQENWNWRLAYFIFAITTPLVSFPIIYLLFHTKHVAIRKGILKPNELKRREPWLQQAKTFAVQFDAVGSVLFVAGLALILLPLSQRAQPSASDGSGWFSASTLSKFLAGYTSLCLFGIWEWKYAPVHLIPYRVVFGDRTVLGSCLLCFISFAAFNSYHAYFPSYLQVARYLSIREAGYIANIFSLTSCLLGVVFAYVIRQTGRYKRLGLWALPLRSVGALALIPAVRDARTTSSAADVVACQLANAVAGAVLIVANQTAVNAAVAHADLAIVLAVLLLFSSVGASVGTAIAGAIWTASMPGLIRDFLPEGKKDLAEELYGSLKKQLEWAPGTDVRDAVVKAYCVTQVRLCIVAAASVPFVVAFVMMWRDLPVRDEDEGGKDKWKGEGPVEHGD
ncbi:Siderophore iron transporter mirB [Lasiodiplodia hormozganensis]|uniref:Siderophore iron transporter mirB n=1 Tax=Lasiodiplodia hormozganensis TaxID=869390 RepID=A0AA40D7Y2_9PEZI|nr:Siderophore iron transporter mirB [Lasiodiplodia hormozganensis]